MIVRTIPRFLPETRGTDIMKALLWGQAGAVGQEKRLKDLRRSASEYSIDVRFLDIFKFEDGKQPPLIEKNLLSQREIRFDAEYDIDGRSEFFKYDSLKTIRRNIENHL